MELTSDNGDVAPEVRLGRRIRQLRKENGLSLRQLSERVGGFSYSYIGRVELGRQPASDGLVTALDEFFGTGGTLSEIKGLARDIVIAQYSREYVRRERGASRIQSFASSLIPGLLQTKDYARELFRASSVRASDREIDAQVATRMERQAVFLRDEPPYYLAVIDEAAFRRPTLDRRIIREQLEHIASFGSNPYATIQVLPFAQGLHPMLGGTLNLLTLKDGRMVALVESFRSGDVVESSSSLLELVQRFDLARSKALPATESLDLIRNYLKEYSDES
ncbi:XRE family transcriptional regulator [Streptomyces klenkii]|uniref:XRE family transcriptional regulator n=1 Tax=Streptomyces klenkii TaxID=1420899 RepID=A0A3B0A347_9ACTN|nr:helix-turn-helix transcriptional regulator [Streptomyces klenkii]RKN55065.1 XRE family transcriptional regulator [Streptomyces klenkii]